MIYNERMESRLPQLILRQKYMILLQKKWNSSKTWNKMQMDQVTSISQN